MTTETGPTRCLIDLKLAHALREFMKATGSPRTPAFWCPVCKKPVFVRDGRFDHMARNPDCGKGRPTRSVLV